MYAVYSTQEELMSLESELWKELEGIQKGEFRLIGPYYYWLRGRAGHVYRIPKELLGYAKGNQTEKPKDPFKRELTEFQR